MTVSDFQRQRQETSHSYNTINKVWQRKIQKYLKKCLTTKTRILTISQKPRRDGYIWGMVNGDKWK